MNLFDTAENSDNSDLEWDIINNAENFGITFESTRKPFNLSERVKQSHSKSYTTLQNILYGVHNIHPPKKLLQALNSHEILAMLSAVGAAKRQGKHKREIITDPKVLDQFIVDMIHQGYGSSAMTDMKRYGFNSHPDNHHELRQRIAKLDHQTKLKFDTAYLAPYNPSAADYPERSLELWTDPGVLVTPLDKKKVELNYKTQRYRSRIIKAITFIYHGDKVPNDAGGITKLFKEKYETKKK